MREILFRGKRLDNREWVEGLLSQTTVIPEDGQAYVATTIDKLVEKPFDGCWIEVDPATVGQYTGLKDKNGKRIFEGDICWLYFVDTEELGEIVWDEEWCKFAYMSPDGDGYGIDGTVEFEIIGNIHDKRDLLEENDGE